MRKNGKQQVFSYENTIQKSNELSMAKLNQGLTLNQMQLLAYAIYSTQQDGKTEFNKFEFQKKFNLEKYQTKHAKEDVPKLGRLGFSLINLEEDSVEYLNVFQRIKYEKGLFTFRWSDDIVPHILELKEKFVSTDLTITSQFRSSFSWTLYDFLKGHYGFWHKILSKDALMKLFGVEDKKTYQKNTGDFKKTVLDVAITEINKYTELEVRYEVKKEGRSIVGFDLIWSTGKNIKSATRNQIKELKTLVDVILTDEYKYIDLDKQEDRQNAMRLIQDIKKMTLHTQEPICITYDKADWFIKQANSTLKSLEGLVSGKSDLYYNWLEEDE